MVPFYLKKWYLDLITEDGAVAYLYFIATKIGGVRGGNVSAHILLPDGTAHGGAEHGKVALTEAGGSAGLGRSYLINRPDNARLRMEFPHLGFDLQYRLKGNSWIPAPGKALLERKGASLSWLVPFPSASVEGSIRIGAQERSVRGRGYQDMVEMTFPPWRLPITELTWGRAHCGGLTLVFDQLKLTDGTCHQYLRLQSDDGGLDPVEPERFTIESAPDDAQSRLTCEGFELMLRPKQILAQGEIAAGGQIRYRWLARILARISGDPFEKKMISAAELKIGLKTFHGNAIHERVSWRWRRGVAPVTASVSSAALG